MTKFKVSLCKAESITNASKSTVWRANNHDFDRVVAYGSADWYNLGFPGQYYDSEKGSYYNYFRDYDPKTGRYIQSDPIGLAGGINTYGYVGGNPVNWFDFYGLERQECQCASATRKSPSEAYPATVWHGYPNLEGYSGLEGYLEATPLTQQRADRYNAIELENANRSGFTPLGDALIGDLNPIPFSGTIAYFLGAMPRHSIMLKVAVAYFLIGLITAMSSK